MLNKKYNLLNVNQIVKQELCKVAHCYNTDILLPKNLNVLFEAKSDDYITINRNTGSLSSHRNSQTLRNNSFYVKVKLTS